MSQTEERLRMHEDTLQSLVNHGQLVLTVNVTTKEQAEEIISWMYATDKPMKAELVELAWNKQAVSKQEAELLEQMREVLSGVLV